MTQSFLVGFLLGIAFVLLSGASLIRWSRWMEEREKKRTQSLCSHWEEPGPHCGRCGKRLEEES